MSRLADYFVVVGYDHEKARSGSASGSIIQRFPERDWDDCPFTQGLELFCQPAGWRLVTSRQQPSFFISVLTDIDAERHYCACLTFTEDVAEAAVTRHDDDGDDQEVDPALVRHSKMFAPKSIALVSKMDVFDTFRNCLGLIYTVYIENMQVELETLVGNILGCVQVPPPGGPQIRFSIGAGDRQALQPPLSSTLPVTRSSCALLFQQLGISNTISVFCAALTDYKVLFHSQSYSRLTEASHALTSLMYPLKYSYVYIPLLPAGLYEVVNTPTPFIAGVHSSLKSEFVDLLDVIIVDLDGGSLHVPEHVTLTLMPEPVYSHAVNALNMILNPDLLTADYAFPPEPSKAPPLDKMVTYGVSAPGIRVRPHGRTMKQLELAMKSPPEVEPCVMTVQDKQIRAVFLRCFAELFFGYRSCLTVMRIHPKPLTFFHKANFLGHRGLVEDEFVVRVLDSMSFSSFVSERGPPFRVTDLFDEVAASVVDSIQEKEETSSVLKMVKDLAHQLYLNEYPNPQPYMQKIPKPTEGAYCRIHQPPFPRLGTENIHEIIEEGIQRHQVKSKLSAIRPQQPRIVPMGPHISSSRDRHQLLSSNARRLEVLRNCVNCVFENKISDARKIFPAVLRALKSRIARLALVEELSYHVQSNRAMLEHQQFDMVVRLLNCALQNDSTIDENGIAAAILPLATSFCRKLCTGVIQFAYSCVQDHPVWASMQFWEATFYSDVQKQVRQLYLPQYEEHLLSPTPKDPNLSPGSPSQSQPGSTPDSKRRSQLHQQTYKPREISALEIAAEQMRVWPTLSAEDQKEMVSNEESIVYSQAIHYANRMVYLRVPLDASKTIKEGIIHEGESSNSNITNSVAESDSFDIESGFDEQEVSEVEANVVRFVTRFVDKVCSESGVTPEHIKSLHQMIPGVVAMHIETLEAVHRESKRLPPIQKPKLLTPTLLAGEEVVMEGLRVYLIPDGREEGTGGPLGGPALLPAEGAIFLTTYRIIFKGTPCDPLACEQVVSRAFPVSTLTREKKISGQYLQHIDQWLQEGLQLRSNTFQLMKIAFDEEVSSEDAETLRKLINKVWNPPSVHNTFAFTGHHSDQPTPLHKNKEKNASLKAGTMFDLHPRPHMKKSATLHPSMMMSSSGLATMGPMGFAKRTLMKTARKAGLKPKESSRKQKYILPTPPLPRRTLTLEGQPQKDRPSSLVFDDELTVIDEAELAMAIQTDAKNIDRLGERLYCRDYSRLGLGTLTGTHRMRSEGFRVTMVNTTYQLCRSYPAVLVVPQNITDDSLRKFSRTHRQNRFPVVTWRHPRTKAVLLRGSGFHGKSVMGMLKGHNTSAGSSGSETSTSLEQEKYFSSVVAATPLGNSSHGDADLSDSLTSLDSLLLSAAGCDPLTVPETPDSIRRSLNPISRAVSSLRSSGGRVKLGGLRLIEPPSGLSTFNRANRGSLRASFSRTQATLGRMGSLRDKASRMSTGSLQYSLAARQNGSIDHDLSDVAPQSFHKAVLYVLGEKTQMKGIKMESFPKCDFIPVDYYEVRHVRSAFKKLMRACVPSAPYTDPNRGYLRAVEESGWLPQLQNILQIAGAVVDLLDVQGSSVMICLEDGWDFTTQVVSVAQVLLDPYYRTLEGFRALVEKEWLSFGHRFSHRSNQTAANQASGFAPLFLQFLDVVHQIQRQFPLAFEFNQYYLKFLAYHYVSNRFRTCMLDNEWERMDAGWLLDDKPKSKFDSAAEGEPGFSPRHTTSHGQIIWDYIDRFHRKGPIFYNFQYSPLDQQDAVLRPYSNISNLVIWDYYVKEDLAHGPSYDLEMMAMEDASEDDVPLSEGPATVPVRRIVNGCYDDVTQLEPDSCTYLLQEIQRLESELGHLPQKWRPLWERLEHPARESLTRQVSFNTAVVRSHGRSIHKRSTIEILVKGKMLGEAAKMFSQPHRFEKFTYTTPAYCDYCSHVLWGLVKTGMRCAECGYNCHERCVPHVPKNCTKLRPVSEVSTSSTAISKGSLAETASITGEHRTHEGYLYKRGALLKGWKQRWFVLDSMKHQLRYYDSSEDSHCKGFIDLAEVVSVSAISIKNAQGAPKKADENSFFEMKTIRRIYNFLAPDISSAHDWIDKIQSCIQ